MKNYAFPIVLLAVCLGCGSKISDENPGNDFESINGSWTLNYLSDGVADASDRYMG